MSSKPTFSPGGLRVTASTSPSKSCFSLPTAMTSSCANSPAWPVGDPENLAVPGRQEDADRLRLLDRLALVLG